MKVNATTKELQDGILDRSGEIGREMPMKQSQPRPDILFRVERALLTIRTRPWPVRYSIGVGFVAIALAIRLGMAPVSAGLPYLTFFPANALVAILCGFGPGLMAIGLTAVLITVIFSQFDMIIGTTIIYFFDGLVVCFASLMLQRYTDEAQAARKLADRQRDELQSAKAESDRANLSKSKFLAAASHDLRQPVQSLTLLLSLIEGQVKAMPRTVKTVEMAKSAVDSLNGLLTGILDISKLDAGVVAPTMASVNLGEMIDRLAKEYAPRAASEGLKLRHVSPALSAATDAALMDRILRNLIENALRYTKKGGILIGLRLRGGKVRLDVIDSGIGIPPDKRAEIFEEFRQLDNPARDASRGLGLGLAIVSRLARLLGAPMEVASRVGQGTRFSLLLPLDHSVPPTVGAARAFEGAYGRILLIEDDRLIRQAYEMMLEEWGHETISAASGEEALDRAAQANWDFDAIIADHRLGSGLTGNDAAAEIARRAERSYPTVLVTGDTAKERLAEFSASGFITLHKPVEKDELHRAVQSLLGGNRRSTSGGASR